MNAIEIIGGGLAGLTLGIILRQREIPVTIHEAGRYPRHRVCGEFLSGAGERVLGELGLGEVLRDGFRQRSTVWYRGSRQVFAAELPEAAVGVSRFALDDRLAKIFCSLGGELREDSRVAASPAVGRVWCAGRIPMKGAWVGLKCHVPELELGADLEMHLGTNGYVGMARIENGRVNICGLFRREARLGGKVPEYLRAGGLAELAGRIESSGPDESSNAAVAGFCTGWQREIPGLMTVGDACGMIPPFTGNGMSMAFEAAQGARDPLVTFASGESNWNTALREVRKTMRRRFTLRLRAARILHPFLTDPSGQALLATVSRFHLLPFALALRFLR